MSSVAKASSLEDKALALLSSGLPAIKVAEALGVDTSRISQLVSSEEFASKLTEAKYEFLSRHNEADAELDTIESKIRAKMLDCLDSVYKPMELTRMLQVVNASKRRGSSAPASITEQQTVLNLVLPSKIINNFVTNINNQVIQAGTTELLTMQSSTLASKVKTIEAQRIANYEHAQPAGERETERGEVTENSAG